MDKSFQADAEMGLQIKKSRGNLRTVVINNCSLSSPASKYSVMLVFFFLTHFFNRALLNSFSASAISLGCVIHMTWHLTQGAQSEIIGEITWIKISYYTIM